MLSKRIAKLERLTLPGDREPVTVRFDFGNLGEGEPFTISKIEWLKIKRGMIQTGSWVETPDGGLKFVIQGDSVCLT